MFDSKKDDKEKDKLKKQLRKHAIQEQMKYDAKKKESDKIKDEAYVQTKLAEEKLKDEELMRRRDQIVSKNLAGLNIDVKNFKCKTCNSVVELENLTCPNCGQLYCQYCGYPMDMENPGQCPRCGGAPFYQPAELVITKVEDIPPEERFWEELPSCPKCSAAVQPDWSECPICGAKLSGKGKIDDGKADTGEWTEQELEAENEDNAPKSPKEIARQKRKEQMQQSKKGV